MKLCEHLPKQQNHKLCFDNYFNFIELQLRLKEQGIWTCGTIRSNRLRGCPFLSEQALKAVVYLRATQNTSETRVSFVAAKSKVAPRKKLGVP
ncbi:hypothetical protein T03_5394 [Trichinella britovi]|uniref:PiggyBac transposable element-derived protein domain-containing protein n=1 Tax=Trichinella britovi TaxID=45882 RepID=A0A0V1C7D0_TRIBR|nr:hypothetical protein T03_5394 [Trichinella britovi]